MNLTLTYVIRFNITWGSLFFIDREATRFAVSNCIHYWQMVQINAIVKSPLYYLSITASLIAHCQQQPIIRGKIKTSLKPFVNPGYITIYLLQ